MPSRGRWLIRFDMRLGVICLRPRLLSKLARVIKTQRNFFTEYEEKSRKGKKRRNHWLRTEGARWTREGKKDRRKLVSHVLWWLLADTHTDTHTLKNTNYQSVKATTTTAAAGRPFCLPLSKLQVKLTITSHSRYDSLPYASIQSLCFLACLEWMYVVLACFYY